MPFISSESQRHHLMTVARAVFCTCLVPNSTWRGAGGAREI